MNSESCDPLVGFIIEGKCGHMTISYCKNFDFLAEIDECAEGIHDCYNESYCDNSPAGSYTCTCPTEEGLVLFTEDGMNGFNVRDGETGMKDGDMYHINHTCIRKCTIINHACLSTLLSHTNHM